MNRSNGTTGIVAEIDGFLRLPCTVAVPIFFATYIRGYLWHGLWHSLWHTHFVYFFASLLFDCYYQAIPRQKERRGERRERPPLFCRSIGKQEKGFGAGYVTGFGAYPAPPYGGRFRPIYPCGKAVEPISKVASVIPADAAAPGFPFPVRAAIRCWI